MRIITKLALLATAAVLSPMAARAAAAPAPALEEVVVTAEKREGTVQSTPMAITAFSGQTLERQGVTDFRDYAVHVPNLAFAYASSLSAGAQAIAIRGVYGRATTGLYLDDTPLPMSVDPRVLDLARIEVLRGPQGTLYGARSMGGTVRLITRQPDLETGETRAHAVASYTEHGGANGALDASVNLPLVADKVALRVVGFDSVTAGIYDRAPSAKAPVAFATHKGVDGSRQAGGSATLSISLFDDALRITPRVLIQDGHTDGHSYADVRPGQFTQSRLFDLAEPGSDKWALYNVTTRYRTPVGDLTFNAASFRRRTKDSEDSSEVVQLFFGTPATPVMFRERGLTDETSQELRFTSHFEGPLQVTLGAFHERSDNRIIFPTTPLGTIIANVYSQDTHTLVTETAVFGEATWDVTDKLRLIAGARGFDNKVAFTDTQAGVASNPGTFIGAQHQRGINPKFGIEYRVNPDAMLYATAAKGFRIGGVNSFSATQCAADLAALGLTAGQARGYDSDSLWNYEGGAKTSWLDHRLTVNGAVFVIDWSDVQQPVSLPHCGFSVSVNGGAARSQGGELEVQAALTEGLKATFSAGYDDAKITNGGPYHVVPVGSRISQVPKWTLSAAADYSFEVGGLPAFARADVAYVGSSFSSTNDPVSPRLRPAYTLVNLRAGADLGKWRLTLFADNLFNRHANLSDAPAQAIELPGRPRIVSNTPRTIGLDARAAF